ncbi:AcuC Deacetylases, including yeast histone deacetylase and acetoin utilization protein [Burkholderiales bacterium]|jgi:acetoin utilization deacetylase AcuC-like enzyme
MMDESSRIWEGLILMLGAYITHTDCSLHEMGSGHPECPERLGAIHDMLLTKGLLDYLTPYEAPLASLDQVGRAHTMHHVQQVVAAAPSQGYAQLDPDTAMNPHTLQAALRAAGAAILATDLVLDGQHPVAFCNVRPPGHHAKRDEAMGFCFFNNAAVGMRHALDVRGLSRVALIDFDVHHGNGSEDIFHDDLRVLMCSTFQTGLYPFNGDQPMGPNMVNIGLPSRSRGDAFQAAVGAHWIPALDAFRPELIFISAGFDAHYEDDMGNLGLLEKDYEWVTNQIMGVAERHAKGRVVSCLEGGYNLSALARSATSHVRALIGI